ncbi:RcnB family protein [Acinetobacter sp. AYS6]|uniref:RcnB family protein n=1 Tax=Acinetobacter TaxID=469 RepID=UPI00195AB07C|nr:MULTISPECIES: RcnB family protein [unclassified Acinetobacter]MBM7139674.1 RcnB family protein [Acinetobacter sp. 105-3]MCU7698983.1 RcnB family protein [Acinetobacter sp. AYS6]
MKKLTTAIVLSLSGLVATTAMAGPNDHNYHDNYRTHEVKTVKVIKKDDHHNVWRAGQVVPREYQHSRYVIDYRQHQKLTKPGRYQKWYKVNGNYVLVNEQSHKIIRVVH